ncbi:hypothetical protein PoB_001185800 [Plakobranchus ocellatus]|uniref:Uncharacterized protein n=1 Tax=Plakobranchus ocellatus TaxID=259542 RepID=A0AAV3YS18_9GAST|nr:hypothetical protein PoB_001185800 [Plakobranchus ocellatus]
MSYQLRVRLNTALDKNLEDESNIVREAPTIRQHKRRSCTTQKEEIWSNSKLKSNSLSAYNAMLTGDKLKKRREAAKKDKKNGDDAKSQWKMK